MSKTLLVDELKPTITHTLTDWHCKHCILIVWWVVVTGRYLHKRELQYAPNKEPENNITCNTKRVSQTCSYTIITFQNLLHMYMHYILVSN